MILYLTSSPCVIGADRAMLNPQNGFLDHLKADIHPGCKCLYIASSPDDPAANRRFGGDMFSAFAEAGMLFREMRILQRDTMQDAKALVDWSDLIILAGGHVPTQNAFFAECGLRQLLQSYRGVVMGISAGSMNCADEVYAQPEMPGESIDPDYRRFVPGLGLTDLQILPHYQQVKDDILDGKRLYEDITFADSRGHSFLALPDGSYVCVRNGISMLHGEAYLLRNSKMRKICTDGQSVML
jgi:peptidase E